MWNLPEVRVYLKEMNGITSEAVPQTFKEAFKAVADTIRQLDREEMIAINLDAAMHPLNYHVISIGSQRRTPSCPASTFKAALLSNAASILIMHNHPSGDLRPSEDDLETTRHYFEIGKMLEVDLLDHWIVGPGSRDILSIRDNHPELFEQPGKEAAA